MPETIQDHPRRARRLKLAGILGLCAAGAVVAVGLAARVYAGQELKSWNRAQAIPTVALATILGGGERNLVLPGDVQAYYSAPIHARVSGYLRRWYTDIGATVKAGQVLADIDTPDLDQQVLQARADLAAAQANQDLARTTASAGAGFWPRTPFRPRKPRRSPATLAARVAATNAARAALDRLLALESFKRITAPFDGVVTSRSTDIGALIAAGSPSDPALFTVSDQHRLRVYVHVPQAYTALIGKGAAADMTVPEYPGRIFKAVVVNDSSAINGDSGALTVELQIDNADGRLKSGEYAQVSFKLNAAPATIRIPASAVLYRDAGPMVAVVGPDRRIRLLPIAISRDLGASIEIASGLPANDQVVDNPPEALAQGDLVRVAAGEPDRAGG